MYRCLNDQLWGYCNGTPQFEGEDGERKKCFREDTWLDFGIVRCGGDPKTCGQYLSHSEYCQRVR